jgi:hypothetical protein
LSLPMSLLQNLRRLRSANSPAHDAHRTPRTSVFTRRPLIDNRPEPAMLT